MTLVIIIEIIETLQCRKRPFGPSSLHRPQSHPGPTPITPHIYPANPPDTRVNLAWPINLTHTSLECGRKPEHLEETHADTGRMCKLHTDSDPRLELNPSPWCCEAAVLTTVPPCRGSSSSICTPWSGQNALPVPKPSCQQSKIKGLFPLAVCCTVHRETSPVPKNNRSKRYFTST